LLYCAHKENGDYQYVGLDWRTGALRERWIFPDDSRIWNAVGGITTILEDGDLLIGGPLPLNGSSALLSRPEGFPFERFDFLI